MHNLLWGRKEGDQAPGRKQILLSHNQRNRETSNDMQLIQLNLNHCRAAQDLLKQTVRELGSEVAILSEPYRVKSSSGRVTDSTGKAALWLCRVGACSSGRPIGSTTRQCTGGARKSLACAGPAFEPPSLQFEL